MKTHDTGDAAFETRQFEEKLRKALRNQPRAELSPGFAAKVRMAAMAAPSATLVPPAALSPSRAQMFMASLLFIVSFAGGSLYSSGTSTATQTGNDPMLFSLYYSGGSVL